MRAETAQAARAAAHDHFFASGRWRKHQRAARMGGAQQLYHNGKHLRPPSDQQQKQAFGRDGKNTFLTVFLLLVRKTVRKTKNRQIKPPKNALKSNDKKAPNR